ncbi:MAG: phenylalanine--tRNA ligase subunit beta [Bacteroidales bacterium]|nr:phenylalanine--tRNA ligase subunit beta [Bacteroidales bacterium]MCF8345302.1 phenylalanine--tRNA ligase subunit beta [Bacteroidales bacterium]MCF8351912.1 phenylalanine--tRNA ligase subunit beta [Bacteroidales bacterium]MCF8376447.1 phenylalanine--tRNA ligase subunit beta [Bacteroidales bacterium]MCF8400566.1 phenylalanine--tRNA ligase subunit beta [Bacteroidales bacterium]
MKISYSWLKNYIKLDINPEKVSEILTKTGLEVEGFEKIETVKGGMEGIVIGEVLEKNDHPDADKLCLTKVNIGSDEPLSIVCGAPNVESGQKVVVATIGAELFMGDKSLKIKKAKIRGQKSEGMICAEDEVGLGTSHEGIMVLDKDAVPGTPAKEYFDVKQDYVYEIGLTPNRMDAISHIGTARDLVAALNQQNKSRNLKLNLPDLSGFNIDNQSHPVDVIIEDAKACPRFSGISISDIQVGDSPNWIKNYLNAVGIRPINNIVDITNFVMLEYGQPLHAYDADKITDNKVVVKKLPDKTKFITLDEEERELTSGDLMICDAKEGMCIAGVFGGAHSGVTESTKNIFLESAYFDPKTIRKTAKYHGLQTDASFRFERGTDPNNTVNALKRAAMLIRETTGGKITSKLVDVYPEPILNFEFDVKYRNINRLIGKHINREEIKSILKDLEIGILDQTKEGLRVSVPPFRADVTREADVIEEILRIYGYDNIELSEQLKSALSFRKKPDAGRIQNLVSDYLTANGFHEMMNNSLSNSDYVKLSKTDKSENNVVILNPISKDLDIMRQNMLFDALETVAYNQNRKANDLKLYEFGKTYKKYNANSDDALSAYHEQRHLSIIVTGRKQPESWATEDEKVDVFLLKAYVENIFKKLGIDEQNLSSEEEATKDFDFGLTYKIGNQPFASIGKANKSYLKYFDIGNEVYYADINWDTLLQKLLDSEAGYNEIPKYPAARRDLALLIDKAVSYKQIEEIARKTEKKLLKSVNLFDVYEGENIEAGKKSYAVSFMLQNPDKTLTDKVIDKTMDRLIRALKKELGAVIRK